MSDEWRYLRREITDHHLQLSLDHKYSLRKSNRDTNHLYYILFYFISLRLGHTSIQNGKHDTDHTSTSLDFIDLHGSDIKYLLTVRSDVSVHLDKKSNFKS